MWPLSRCCRRRYFFGNCSTTVRYFLFTGLFITAITRWLVYSPKGKEGSKSSSGVLEVNGHSTIKQVHLKPLPSQLSASLSLPQSIIKNFIFTELPEEHDFPIAYSILIYRDVDQAFRLLRAIYRPSNAYCIHVDKKMNDKKWQNVSQWAGLFPAGNVLVPSERVSVVHARFSVLEADLLCIRELFARFKKWRYFINLTGQEWPLKTNLELVRILKAMNGSNNIEKTHINRGRIPKSIPDPPDNIVIWKGAVHVIVVREFVDFMLHDERSLHLLKYLKRTWVPDESYFSSLNHNRQLRPPGGPTDSYLTNQENYPFLARLKNWYRSGGLDVPCHGRFIRLICIWGLRDVPLITHPDRRELFVNKFMMNVNPDTLAAVEKWFWSRVTEVYRDPDSINVTYYSQLHMSKHHF